jgi:hypothetical protein
MKNDGNRVFVRMFAACGFALVAEFRLQKPPLREREAASGEIGK